MHSIMLNDSLLLNDVIFDKMGHQSQPKLMTPYMEFLFDLDPFRFNGFLIVINNKMRITGESCHLFGNLFSLELNGHWTGIACSHYMVRYEPAPLHVRMMAPLFSNLFSRKLITMVITVVRFTCPPLHDYLRQCPNQPLCIPSKLFCDTVDNCGMGSDELWCPPAVPSFQTDQSSLNSTIYDNIDQHNSSIVFDAVNNSSPTVWVFVLLALAVVPLLIFIGVTIRKQRWHCQETPTIRNMITKAMPFGVGRPSSPSSGLNRRSTSDGETLALLTLGLKNVLQTLPDQHWHDMEYGRTAMEGGGADHDHQHHYQNGNGFAKHYHLNLDQDENGGQRRVHWQ